jgi:lipid II:glycine glycyltransferase (peptidoglycan interpeptide bridge formation enzyme)
MTEYPKYFLQTKEWGQFWLEANPSDHRFFSIKIDEKLEVWIYEYPWQLGAKFWYIPRLDLGQKYRENLLKIIDEAKKSNIIFIKTDFDDNWLATQNLQNNPDLINFLGKQKLQIPFNLSQKKLQFNQTPVLDLGDILENSETFVRSEFEKPPIEKLAEFYQNTQSFWANTNQNVRRYTKKSLTQGWQISTVKNDQTFQDFLKIYNQTKDRQNFAIQTTKYLKNLFNQQNSRLIVLYNSQNQPQSVWFGLTSEQTLTYLYGGNTEESFKNHGQYLLHLVAVAMGATEKLRFYDLGGYDSHSGYGKFKENYRGTIRNFLGPIDFVLNSPKYSLISLLIKFIKIFRR